MKSFKIYERVNLEEFYPAADKKAIYLIYKMLEFNPNNRITAAEAILDSYFDDIRIEEQEDMPPPTV